MLLTVSLCELLCTSRQFCNDNGRKCLGACSSVWDDWAHGVGLNSFTGLSSLDAKIDDSPLVELCVTFSYCPLDSVFSDFFGSDLAPSFNFNW